MGGRTSLHNYDSAKNRLTSISSNVSAYNLSYGYDGQGNISQRGTQAFVFDQGNRIKSATGKETYTYDGFGHRVQELAADGTKLIQIYSSSGQLLMASQTGGGKPAKDTKYVYLNRHLLAEIELAGATTVSYNHTDALGSPIAKTNASGVRTALTKYEPYGLTLSGSTTPTIGFTGHVNDADTGLIYMQQRYYDPAAGRFLSLDPVSTDAHTGTIFNRYSYANNSPYNYIDPDGRLGVAGFIVGASIDVGVQVAGNMGSGQGLSDSLANVRVGQVLVSGALGAFGQIGGFNAARSIVSGMSNGAKGLIGEGAARIGIAVRGETVIASQTAAGKVAELGNITGRAAKAVPDFVTRAADGILDPAPSMNGDQFDQPDRRVTSGFGPSQTWRNVPVLGQASDWTLAVNAGDVISADAPAWVPQVRPAFLGMQCGMSVGLARTSLKVAAALAGSKRGQLSERIAAAQALLAQQLAALLEGVTDGRYVRQAAELFRLRIALAESVQQALTLELQAKGGLVYLVDQQRGFGRRWRESAFIPVIAPSLTQLQAALAQQAAAQP